MISKDTFIRRVQSRTVSHANLLVGEGEEAMAEVLGAARAAYGISPLDEHVVMPAADQSSISIAEVGELRRKLGRKPHSSSHHMVIIWQAALLTSEAQNALLKILEEPVAPTLFFLIAADEQQLLPTVVSRCQRIRIGQEARPAPSETGGILDIVRLSLVEQFRLAERLAKDQSLPVIIDEWILGLRQEVRQGSRAASRILRLLLKAKENIVHTQVNRRLLLEDLFLSLKFPALFRNIRRSL